MLSIYKQFLVCSHPILINRRKWNVFYSSIKSDISKDGITLLSSSICSSWGCGLDMPMYCRAMAPNLWAFTGWMYLLNTLFLCSPQSAGWIIGASGCIFPNKSGICMWQRSAVLGGKGNWHSLWENCKNLDSDCFGFIVWWQHGNKQTAQLSATKAVRLCCETDGREGLVRTCLFFSSFPPTMTLGHHNMKKNKNKEANEVALSDAGKCPCSHGAPCDAAMLMGCRSPWWNLCGIPHPTVVRGEPVCCPAHMPLIKKYLCMW